MKSSFYFKLHMEETWSVLIWFQVCGLLWNLFCLWYSISNKISAKESVDLFDFFCTCFSYCSWSSTCWFCLCFKCSAHTRHACQGWLSSRCAANLSWPKLRLRSRMRSVLNWSHQEAAHLEIKCSSQSIIIQDFLWDPLLSIYVLFFVL